MLREMCGDYIVLAESLELIDFNKLIHLNESAVYLWQGVEGREFDADVLAVCWLINTESGKSRPFQMSLLFVKPGWMPVL